MYLCRTFYIWVTLVVIYAVLLNINIVTKFTIKHQVKDFINRGWGGGELPVLSFFHQRVASIRER